eukprot:m.99261 g.99261  ORF g.99261 m.99261 type:complete len:124 (-) comp8886_c0_seq2:1963-2334(-)
MRSILYSNIPDSQLAVASIQDKQDLSHLFVAIRWRPFHEVLAVLPLREHLYNVTQTLAESVERARHKKENKSGSEWQCAQSQFALSPDLPNHFCDAKKIEEDVRLVEWCQEKRCDCRVGPKSS